MKHSRNAPLHQAIDSVFRKSQRHTRPLYARKLRPNGALRITESVRQVA
jgi:hypothetical protein